MPAYETRCAPRIDTSKAVETGTIGSYPIVCPAWACFDLAPLRSMQLRHQNYLARGFSGTTARQISIDELSATLFFFMDGVQDRNGADHPNVEHGLEANRKDFLTNIVSPPLSPSTRLWSINAADGTTETANIQVVDFQFRRSDQIPGFARIALDILIPTGQLVEV